MLYHAYETAHMMALPFRMAADAMQATLEYPWAPHSGTKLARTMAAQCELFSRLTRRYDKPGFGIHAVQTEAGEAVVTERVADLKPFCRLLHFEKSTGPMGPRVLVVAPVSGHHATLLRGTVRDLLPDHDVYVTDWIDAREVPAFEGPFGFDDYVTYILQMLRFLGGETHIVAVCQPTVPVLAAVSMLALADDRPAAVRAEAVTGALRAGKVLFTTGPFVRLSVEGAGLGETAVVGPKARGHLAVDAAPWVDVTRVTLYLGSRITQRWAVPFGTATRRFEVDFTVDGTKPTYVLARVEGTRSLGPSVGEEGQFTVRPVAVTNPVYLRPRAAK